MQALLQQQQQQQSSALCLSLQQISIATHWLFALWVVIVQQQQVQQQPQPELLAKIACAALPLLHYTQRCSRLFNRAAASTGSRGAAARVVGVPYRELWVWQTTAGRLVWHLTQFAETGFCVGSLAGAEADAMDYIRVLLRHPAASEMLLQLLAVHTAQLYQLHIAHVRRQRPRQLQQQQQQLDPAEGSSSSNQQQQRSAQGAKQQHRADLLSIPAFHQHQDMLQLLPGGQAYLGAAATAVAAKCHSDDDALRVNTKHLRWWTYGLTFSLYDSLKHSLGQPLPIQSTLLASSAAVRLVLEMQLLAAADLQRQQQTGQIPVADQTDLYRKRVRERHEDAARLLLNSTQLLHLQIRASVQASGSSCLPPEVLQQAGLQLLQALAAPVQQLQLGIFSKEMAEMAMLPSIGLSDQLFALRAAATGLAVSGAGPTIDGKEAVTALLHSSCLGVL
jgi:hypothetical protein